MTSVSSLNSPASQMWSEQYRTAAHKFVTLDATARILEDTKSAVFSQMKTRTIRESNEKMSEAAAERITKASAKWWNHITKICDARTRADEARVERDFIRMRAWEESNDNANKRAEMRL